MIKKSTNKLSGTTYHKKSKNSTYEVSESIGSFAKTTKFSRLLGGRGSSGSGLGLNSGGISNQSYRNIQQHNGENFS